VEQLDDHTFATLFPSDCWVFADVLEHLYDPWSLLQRIRSRMEKGGWVVACIPNAQHWSVQARLNLGVFRYEATGLLDRTHIRWFTRQTITELFSGTGFAIEQMLSFIPEDEMNESGLEGVRAMAVSYGADVEMAVTDAKPRQYVVRAVGV
jgi:hypothetical protein